MWTPPSDVYATSQLGRYLAWLADSRGLSIPGYTELWNWSVSDLDGFWSSIWEFFGVRAHEPYKQVLSSREMPGREVVRGRTAELRRARAGHR